MAGLIGDIGENVAQSLGSDLFDTRDTVNINVPNGQPSENNTVLIIAAGIVLGFVAWRLSK